MEIKLLYFLLITIGVIFVVHDVRAEASTEHSDSSKIEESEHDLSTNKIDRGSVANIADIVEYRNTTLPTDSLIILPHRRLKIHRRSKMTNKHKRLGHGHTHHKRKSHSHRPHNKKDSRVKTIDNQNRSIVFAVQLAQQAANSTHTRPGKIRKSGRRKTRRHHHLHNLYKKLDSRMRGLRASAHKKLIDEETKKQ